MKRSGALRVVSFEGMDAERARAAQAAIAPSRPGMMWLPIVGLDRHTPLIGLKVLSEPGQRTQGPLGQGLHEAVYSPLSEQHSRSASAGRDET